MKNEQTDGLFLFAAARFLRCLLRAASRRSLDVGTPTATCDVRPNPRRLVSFRHYYGGEEEEEEASRRTRALPRARARARALAASFHPFSPPCPATSLSLLPLFLSYVI